MSLIDENMAEQAALDWFEELGYARIFGPDIAPQGPEQERENYKVVVLADPCGPANGDGSHQSSYPCRRA